MLDVTHRIKIPLAELNFTFSRSSGPGGQNVNKVNTKATMRWDFEQSPSVPDAVKDRFREAYPRRITSEGEVVIHSQRFRDQGRNVADCMHKLKELIQAVATAPKKRKATKPTKGSQKRRLRNKQLNSSKKQLRKPPKRDD